MKKVSVLTKKTLIKLNSSVLVECKLKVGDQTLLRHSVEHPGCVVILPVLDNKKIVMVKQYRYAARGWLWEIPAGGIEKKENIRAAAKRELMEEAGYAPGKLTLLTSFYPTPGISEEKMHLFLAEKLKPAYAPKDADEEFEIGEFLLSDILKMIRSGKIQDGKTIIGALLLDSIRRR